MKQIPLFVFLFSITVIPSFVFAYEQMPVGDALQPMPQNVHANISGNVNATVQPVHTAASTSAPDRTVPDIHTEVPSEKNTGWFVVTAILTVLLAAMGGWYFFFRIPE